MILGRSDGGERVKAVTRAAAVSDRQLKIRENALGAIHKEYPIFWTLFGATYPPRPHPIFSHTKNYFRLAISDFRKPTHLLKN